MRKAGKINIFAGIDSNTANNVLFSYILGNDGTMCAKLMRNALMSITYKQFRLRKGMFSKVYVLQECKLAPVVAVVVKGKKADVLVYADDVLPWGRYMPEAPAPVVEIIDGEQIETTEAAPTEMIYSMDCMLDEVQQEAISMLPMRRKPKATRCLVSLMSKPSEQIPSEYRRLNMAKVYRKLRGFDDDVVAAYCATFVVRKKQVVRRKR